MSSVLDRSELEQSPLADLHLLANELGVDGFRRLRREELIDAIVSRQSGDNGAEEAEPADDEPVAEAEADTEAEDRKPRRGRRGGRGRGRAARSADEEGATDEDAAALRAGDDEEKVVEGVVELLANGSGFVRLSPPDPTDEDVYISAAQVKRCELVSGDRVTGPVRAPRRSERFPSLIRVETINGAPAEKVAEGTRYEELKAGFPTERFSFGSEDPTVKAIEWLTPFGRGSRVVIAGASRSGKSEALRRLGEALSAIEDTEVSVVLAGVRPEELGETGGLTFAASADAQAQAVEQAIEQGRRVAARGGNAVVLVDTLEYLPPQAARRALAAARNITDGGSLTVVATAPMPFGGETTVVVLDGTLTALGRFPAIDLAGSGVVHPELLVGEAGAEAIAKQRAETLGD